MLSGAYSPCPAKATEPERLPFSFQWALQRTCGEKTLAYPIIRIQPCSASDHLSLALSVQFAFEIPLASSDSRALSLPWNSLGRRRSLFVPLPGSILVWVYHLCQISFSVIATRRPSSTARYLSTTTSLVSSARLGVTPILLPLRLWDWPK